MINLVLTHLDHCWGPPWWFGALKSVPVIHFSRFRHAWKWPFWGKWGNDFSKRTRIKNHHIFRKPWTSAFRWHTLDTSEKSNLREKIFSVGSIERKFFPLAPLCDKWGEQVWFEYHTLAVVLVTQVAWSCTELSKLHERMGREFFKLYSRERGR